MAESNYVNPLGLGPAGIMKSYVNPLGLEPAGVMNSYVNSSRLKICERNKALSQREKIGLCL